MQDLQIVRPFAAEYENLPSERVSIQHLLHLRRQAIEAVTHAHRTTGQILLRPRRDRNHAVALNAESTWRRARSFTKPSTRSLVPSARSISIRPVRPSTLARTRAVGLGNCWATPSSAISAGPPSGARVKTPIGINPGSDAVSIASDRAGSDGVAISAPTEHAVRALRRQLKARLAFTPWRRAISATEAPGKRASAMILRFSSSDHDRRDRLGAGAELNARCPGIAESNDTGPTIRRGNVHYRLMDISPISSGATIIPELAQIG